ncbi:hypothetical protein GS501_09145 [Saccharibacter sp. 17.LH.SD]|uniref:hypothetical protein n=1 Tax=Saccharibacter sp. 17.LH.SD TaxID=2689393 RepID=UPI00136A0CF1|nr:hypothetical protein [Saccharibacter sp. 17.LH.SD]MXV45196.1 hypothetical protein [Saccharibacter sp. 17.LH.SD]
MRFCRALFCVVPLLGLSGCLGVSHPFADPGKTARQLTQDNLPPPRLSVPVLVSKKSPWYSASALWAKDMVIALLGQSVPAVTQNPKPGDWWIRLGAVKVGDDGVKPRYSIVGPDGHVHARGYGAVIDRAGWLAADPAALNTVALQMAPEIAQMLTGIQAQALMDDPHSLMNRSAKVYFAGVQGAPGSGNQELGRAFYTLFPDTRNTIQTTPTGADYTVRAEVSIKDLPDNAKHHVASTQQQVMIIWHVLTAQNQEAGAATQIHAVPAHSLDTTWGDTAGAAAQEAAGAVRTIITNYSGRDHKPLPQAMKGSDNDNDQNEMSGNGL